MSKATRRGKATTTFHDPAPDTSKYSGAIDRAKKKVQSRPKSMEGTPRFDQMPTTPMQTERPPEMAGKEPGISERTAAGLTAMAQATAAAAAAREEEEEEAALAAEEPEEELTSDQRMRIAIEDRLEPLDIGQHLMGGDLLQVIPIVPGKLEVTFRTVTTFEEVFVDNQLAEEQEMTGRQFLRRTNEWALAMHVHSINGTKWPDLFKKNSEIDEKAAARRQANARSLSTPIFNMLIQNLGWYLERVNDSLTVEALGNG